MPSPRRCSALPASATSASTSPTPTRRWPAPTRSSCCDVVARCVRADGWAVGNVDCSVVCEEPKLAPLRDEMEARLTAAAGAPVTVKGRRAEGLGALGRRGHRLLRRRRSSCGARRERRAEAAAGAAVVSRRRPAADAADGGVPVAGAARAGAPAAPVRCAVATSGAPHPAQGRRQGSRRRAGRGTPGRPRAADRRPAHGPRAVVSTEPTLDGEPTMPSPTSSRSPRPNRVPVANVATGKLDARARSEAPQGVIALAAPLPEAELERADEAASGRAAVPRRRRRRHRSRQPRRDHAQLRRRRRGRRAAAAPPCGARHPDGGEGVGRRGRARADGARRRSAGDAETAPRRRDLGRRPRRRRRPFAVRHRRPRRRGRLPRARRRGVRVCPGSPASGATWSSASRCAAGSARSTCPRPPRWRPTRSPAIGRERPPPDPHPSTLVGSSGQEFRTPERRSAPSLGRSKPPPCATTFGAADGPDWKSRREFSAGRHSYGAVVIVAATFVDHPVADVVYAPMKARLAADGRQVSIFGLPGGGLGDISATAAAVAAHVDAVRSATGAAKVDLIAHSQGGIVVCSYTRDFGGATKVDSAITLGAPNNGTAIGNLSSCSSGRRAGMPASRWPPGRRSSPSSTPATRAWATSCTPT